MRMIWNLLEMSMKLSDADYLRLRRAIALEQLIVPSARGEGKLAGTNIVQRLNTRGGVAAGPCEKAGSYRSVPYSADYVFLRKE